MARDLRYEAWLEEQGVPYEFKAQEALDTINRSLSASNAGRIGRRLDPELVEEYAIAMRNGAAFPPLIIYEGRLGRTTISGAHRLGAADKAGITHFDMYIVGQTDEYVFERMLASANVVEGARPSREQLLQHGIRLVTTFNATIKDVADSLKLPYGALEKAVAYHLNQKRILGSGARTDRLNSTQVLRLGAIPNDKVLREATELVHETRLPTDLVNTLVKDIRAAKTEDDQLRIVAEWNERPEVAVRRAQTRRGRERGSLPIRAEFFRHLNGLETLLKQHTTLAQLQVTSDEDKQKAWKTYLAIKRQMEEGLYASAGTVLPYRTSTTAAGTAG